MVPPFLRPNRDGKRSGARQLRSYLPGAPPSKANSETAPPKPLVPVSSITRALSPLSLPPPSAQQLRAGKLSEADARQRLSLVEDSLPRGADEPQVVALARVALLQRFGRAAARDIEAELDSALDRHCASFLELPYGAGAAASIRRDGGGSQVDFDILKKLVFRLVINFLRPGLYLPQGWSCRRR